MRRGGAGVLLLALPVLALGAVSSAAARPSVGGRSAPTVRVLDASLTPVLRRDTLRVSVRAPRPGRFRIFATALPAGARGAPVTITHIAVVRLPGRRTGTVSLRLLAAGRGALAGCAARTLEVRAVATSGPHAAAGRTHRVRHRLAGPR